MTSGGAILLTWGFAYASTVAWALLRRKPACASVCRTSLDGVLLVRPCAGAEPGLDDTLRSSVVDGDPSVAVRFTVASEGDSAWPIATRVSGELRTAGYDARVVISGTRGANGKASQIATVLRSTPCLIVVIADCDVRLEPGDLATVVAPVAMGPARAAWAPPVPTGDPLTLGDHVVRGVLGATLQAFPLLAALDHSGMVGKLVAVDRKTLDEIGSFDALVGSLGEDVELASRLRARGASIVVAGVARSRPRGVDLRRALERFVRWLLVVRAQRPWLLVTYPLFFFPAIPCALLALASGGVAGRIAASLFLLARVSVASSAIPRVLRETSALEAVLEGLAGDAMLAVAFARVLASPRVRWAGAALRVTAGRIEPEEP